MLSRLQVRNYVLIDSLEIDFPEGLIIITGQTGAGKSILLGALSLLMGAKAEASMVSEGADNCVVEAEFAADRDDLSFKALLEENEVEWEDGNLTIRRVVNRSGRSRAFVNDSPVPVTVLQDISSRLVDIHSQHQTLLLSDRHFQLDTLDYFAGNLSLREECTRTWARLQQQLRQINELEQRLSRISADREYNEAQFSQLEAASLREGELAELEEELRCLTNAEEIKSGLCAVEEIFEPSVDAPSLDLLLKEMSRHLAKTGKYMSEASRLCERIDSCRCELDDIYAEVSSMNSRVEMSQERLSQVEDRLSLLYSLLQKHGCRNETELLEVKNHLAEQLFDSTAVEEKLVAMKAAVSETRESLEVLASDLHRTRSKASVIFADEMTRSIRNLELPYAVFGVEVTPSTLGADGADSVVFSFSATGRNVVDLSKCASGGEMSRIMLALKAMRARYTHMPTMIFDEIDTGVSGSVADKMGSMICEMGSYMQVFAITHLPQVAAKGEAHYLVTKEVDTRTGMAVSKIERLSGEQRVLEVARMLSGSVLTEAAVANAESLLNN